MRRAQLLVCVLTACGASTNASSRQSPAGVVNVRDFGAVGDGVANDTGALHASIRAACTGHGGVMYLPPGTYRYTESLRLVGADCSDVTIRGDGPATKLLFVPSPPFRETFNDRAIYLESRVEGPFPIASSINSGARELEAAQPNQRARNGDWLVVYERDARAQEIVAVDWVQVASATATRISVERPFRTAFTSERKERGFYLVSSLLQNVHLRDFALDQPASTRSVASITIGMALRTRVEGVIVDNARGNGLAVYRAKDVGVRDVTIVNAREQANEFAATVDFRIVNSSFGFEQTSTEGAADTSALTLDFGSAYFAIVGNSFHSAGNIAVMMLDGVHDGTFAGNSIGWTKDVGIGVGQGLSARGIRRVVIRNNSFAGGDASGENTCIGIADSVELEAPIASTGNLVGDNLCPNYSR